MELVNLLINSAKKLDIEINQEQAKSFVEYKDLLLKWNAVMNLTAITDEREIVIKHFIDSLTCIKYIAKSDKVIDIGAGAGFPSMPIKIFYGQELSITVVDSISKKLKFISDLADKLKFENVTITHARAEDLGHNTLYREKYDKVVSRAVAALPVLAEYCLPMLKSGGVFLSMKGESPEEEIKEATKAINILGGRIIKVDKILLPESDIVHSLIVIEKVKKTPLAYPRKPGKVDKDPIK